MEHGDFGQAYKGARKFEVQRKRALAELNLADLWPRPDFRAAALSGDVKPSVALLYMAVYDNLRRKAVSRPETDELTLGFWSRMYRSGVGFMRRAWELRQYHTADRLTRAFRASQESLTLTEGERRFATAATAKAASRPARHLLISQPASGCGCTACRRWVGLKTRMYQMTPILESSM